MCSSMTIAPSRTNEETPWKTISETSIGGARASGSPMYGTRLKKPLKGPVRRG